MSPTAKNTSGSANPSSMVSEEEIPSLSGGILLDQIYLTNAANLNKILFSEGTSFRKKWAVLDGSKDLEEGPWMEEGGQFKRILRYTKSTRSLPWGFKATEEQIYLRRQGRVFAVMLTASTPDVPFGKCFVTEMLYYITEGPPQFQESSHLRVSYRLNFVRRTIMRGFIEGKARQELKENYRVFANVLAEFAEPFDVAALRRTDNFHDSDAGVLAHTEQDIKVIFAGFCQIRSLASILVCFFLHSFVNAAYFSRMVGIDLPNCFGQLITGSLLVWQLRHILRIIIGFLYVWFAKKGYYSRPSASNKVKL